MQITEALFKGILTDLIEENPLACRALLRIAETRFTDEVPSLAMTLGGDKPGLLVNLDFLKMNCWTETHVKAVILHEFLHVLLNHTEKFKKMTPSLNIALDAVINSIIHRLLGVNYSEMMSIFYADAQGPMRLLRPITRYESDVMSQMHAPFEEKSFGMLWHAVYDGKLVADDILEIAESLDEEIGSGNDPFFIGDHSDKTSEDEASDAALKALEVTLKSMTGTGVWHKPEDRQAGHGTRATYLGKEISKVDTWTSAATAILRRCLTPDRTSRNHEAVNDAFQLPVLNESDKRGFLKATWSPFIPEILWPVERRKPLGTAQIYLDVSGSMDSELQALLALLSRLRRWIRMPFWAFSNVVAPASIKDGKLETSTTGGTSIDAVLEHVAKTRPGRAVIVTDGFIEPCNPKLLAEVRDQKLFAIVSHNGNTKLLDEAGIPNFQLPRFGK